jgi:hypothetical protein
MIALHVPHESCSVGNALFLAEKFFHFKNIQMMIVSGEKEFQSIQFWLLLSNE